MMKFVTFLNMLLIPYCIWQIAPAAWEVNPGSALVVLGSAAMLAISYACELLSGKKMGLTGEDL